MQIPRWGWIMLVAVSAVILMAGTVWWLYISMHRYGGLAAPLAGAAVLALLDQAPLSGAGTPDDAGS
nr:hypothetical protein [uncultured Flavobacterium sp.]